MPERLEHDEALITLAPAAGNRLKVDVSPRSSRRPVGPLSCVTDYPGHLVELVLAAKGPWWLCDEILREEDPARVGHDVAVSVSSVIPPGALAERTVLDFGCGAGASTIALARLFPRARIIGVDLEERNVAVALARAAHRGLTNVGFAVSPGPSRLPAELPDFHVVCLSAVLEHLLPSERRRLLPELWRRLRPGGFMFLSETPHRWWPHESHTTGLWGLNYLPAPVAHATARRFSHRVRRTDTWEDLLRKGVRGATAREVLSYLPTRYGRPTLLAPEQGGHPDPVDLWWATARHERRPRLRRALGAARRTTGCLIVPYLYLAVGKSSAPAKASVQLLRARTASPRRAAVAE